MGKIGKLFVISAPSGGGKTTVSREVITRIGITCNVQKVITYTSRAPRPGEFNGVDYHFITQEAFSQKIAEGFFLETTNYDGYSYGSSASIIKDLERGTSFLMVTDRPGALVIQEKVPGSILMWITLSNPLEIKERLIKRGEKNVERRFAIAQQEIEQEKQEKRFKYRVFNDIFEKAVNQVCTIIQTELDCDNSSR